MSGDIIYCSHSRVYVKLHILQVTVGFLSPSTLNSCFLYIHIGQTSTFSTVILQSTYPSKFMVSSSFRLKFASPNYVFFLFFLREKLCLSQVSCQNSLSGIRYLYTAFSLLDSAPAARNLSEEPFARYYCYNVICPSCSNRELERYRLLHLSTKSVPAKQYIPTLCTEASLEMQNLHLNRS